MNASITKTLVLILVILSGMTGLIYEVLWMRQLTQLFGSAAYATATTLAIFFLGLALGGYVWGRIALRVRNLLLTYAGLELAIAVSAGLYLLLYQVYGWIYSPLFALVGHNAALYTVVKFLLVLSLLLIPSFLMGGTLPLLGGVLVGDRDELGRTGSLMYGLHTLGACVGAFAAGFLLPNLLGYRASYSVAISLNVLLALSAFALYRTTGSAKTPHHPPETTPSDDPDAPTHRRFWIVVFASGFITLALEVIWTRMFGLVVRSDVYSFAVTLVTFLVALSLGGVISHLLCRWGLGGWRTLRWLLALSGLSVAFSPIVFFMWTGGLQYQASSQGWASYVTSLCGLAAVVIFLPTVVMGTVFPLSLSIARDLKTHISETFGTWISVNILGSVVGSLAAGFILIKAIGIWLSVAAMAALYFALAALAVDREARWHGLRRAIYLALGLSAIGLVIGLPSVKLNAGEVLEDVLRGSDGVVSVIRTQPEYYPDGHDNLALRVNNHFTMGGSGEIPTERRQAHIPLWLNPEPKSVFFLGMGSGISAGGALAHSVERVVVAEVVPEIIEAARTHFRPYTLGLFSDERVEIVAEDGRNYLRGTGEQFDVIIGDLFHVPTRGTADLYTREHFECVKEHLRKTGVFAQWLPMFQMSKRELGITVKTFLSVFPEATLWRGNFLADRPMWALVGMNYPPDIEQELHPGNTLNAKMLTANIRKMRLVSEHSDAILIDALQSLHGLSVLVTHPEQEKPLKKMIPLLSATVPFAFYVTNVSAIPQLFESYPIQTDDWPILEFLAPQSGGEDHPFQTRFELESFQRELAQALPPEQDPYLKKLSKKELDHIRAGRSLYLSSAYKERANRTGDPTSLEESRNWYGDYLRKIGAQPNTSP